MDKVFQTSLERQRARHTPPQFVEIQANAPLSSDDDTLESTASTSGQTTNYGEARISFESEYVVLNAPENFINNKEFTQVLNWLKLSDNASQCLPPPLLKRVRKMLKSVVCPVVNL